MENQSNSFFDLVVRDYEDHIDWPMMVDEPVIEYNDTRQVGYEDNEGNLRDGNGNILFARRLFDDDYLSFDEIRAYEIEYENYLNEHDTIISYEQFLDMHHLPLSLQMPTEEEQENMLDRITLFTIDPPVNKQAMIGVVFECPICYDDICQTQRVVPSCRHVYCKSCMLQHLDSFQSRQLVPSCALCREPYSFLEIFEPNVFEEVAQCVRKEV